MTDRAVDDYAMMLRRLARKLRDDHVWRDRITGLLQKHGGLGSPLRDAELEAAPEGQERERTPREKWLVVPKDELILRRIIFGLFDDGSQGAGKYGDDGELQLNSRFCHIDLRRDTAEEIERKLHDRALRILAAPPAPPAPREPSWPDAGYKPEEIADHFEKPPAPRETEPHEFEYAVLPGDNRKRCAVCHRERTDHPPRRPSGAQEEPAGKATEGGSKR